MKNHVNSSKLYIQIILTENPYNMDPIRAKIKMNIRDVLQNLPPILDDFEFCCREELKSEGVFDLPFLKLENSVFEETLKQTDELEKFKLKKAFNFEFLESEDFSGEQILGETEELDTADLLPPQNFSRICQKNVSNNKTQTIPTQCGVPECNIQFESVEEYLVHFDFEHKYIPCPKKTCNVNMTKRYMPEHLESSHPNDFQECKYCRKYVFKRNHTRHQKICNAMQKNLDIEEIHSCPHKNCNKFFKTKYYLVKHVRNVHCKSIACPVLGCKKMIKASMIKDHIENIHQKKYHKQCNTCGKNISRKSIYRHYRTCMTKITKTNLHSQLVNDN